MPYIYYLTDSTGDVRYVGKTDGALCYRLQTHIADAKARPHAHKSRWINKVVREGDIVRIILIEKATSKNWERRERYWIKRFRQEGCRLTNVKDGGENGPVGGGWKLTPEQIERSRQSRLAYYQRLRDAGIPIVSSRKGAVLSAETRKKLSDARKGKPGHPHTDEFKKQLAERNSKRVWSEESRRRASEAAKQRHARERAREGGDV